MHWIHIWWSDLKKFYPSHLYGTPLLLLLLLLYTLCLLLHVNSVLWWILPLFANICLLFFFYFIITDLLSFHVQENISFCQWTMNKTNKMAFTMWNIAWGCRHNAFGIIAECRHVCCYCCHYFCCCGCWKWAENTVLITKIQYVQ